VQVEYQIFNLIIREFIFNDLINALSIFIFHQYDFILLEKLEIKEQNSSPALGMTYPASRCPPLHKPVLFLASAAETLR